jgi:hypothetical protein
VSWFLRALAPLRVRPSSFLADFAGWAGRELRAELRAGSPEIEALQLGWLSEAYRRKGREGLLPLLSDLVRFESAWGRALAEGESTVLELQHEPGLIIEPPLSELQGLASLARPRPSRIRVAPGKGGPRVTILGRGSAGRQGS